MLNTTVVLYQLLVVTALGCGDAAGPGRLVRVEGKITTVKYIENPAGTSDAICKTPAS